MGEDFGSWQRLCPKQSPNVNCCIGTPHELNQGKQDLDHQTALSAYDRYYSVSFSTDPAGISQLKSIYGNDLGIRNSSTPQQIWTLAPRRTGDKLYISSQCGNAASTQKRFLVFDRSRNRSSLILTSAGHGFQIPSSTPDQKDANDELLANFSTINNSSPVLHATKEEGYNWLEMKHERDSSNSGSEMHEDTAELDALLYSDDSEDDEYVENEEASTAHSPDGNEVIDDKAENPIPRMPTSKKRLRLESDSSIMDTASSGKRLRSDAESSCMKDCHCGALEEESSPCQGLGKERIRETLDILRSMIPYRLGSSDPLVVINESIRYLRSMRLKAQALGTASAFV